jgi:hypothetical protein
MTTLLQIDGDPTFWVLGDGAPADAIQQGLNGPPVGGIPGGVIRPATRLTG